MTATTKIDVTTLSILSTLCTPTGSSVTIDVPLPRDQYLKVDKVLTAMGGRWNRKIGAHVFAADPSDVLNAVIATGTVTDIKKALDQFNTPPALARELVARAGVRLGHLALEPSAGTGNIAQALVEAMAQVWAIEIDPRFEAQLCEIIPMAVMINDFMKVPAVLYDRIVMNPPFSRQQDIDHITHAYGMLVPGGVLVAVASAGVFFRRNAKADAFRRLVAKHGTMEPLPSGSFLASGTNVEAFVVELRRP